MRPCRDEVDIGLYSKARGRQNTVAAQSVIARKTGCFDQLQPFFDAAQFRAIAVVIENALAPRQAESRILAPRKNRGVFDRNAALIKIAIERPGLKLAPRELALVHQQVKCMLVVIALFSNDMEAGHKLRFGEK